MGLSVSLRLRDDVVTAGSDGHFDVVGSNPSLVILDRNLTCGKVHRNVCDALQS